MIKLITKNQIITINTLLTKLGLQDDKPRIICEASGMRTSSTLLLYYDEAQQLINFLNRTAPGPSKGGGKAMKKLFAIAHDLGWIQRKWHVVYDGMMEEKNDYSILLKWVEEKGYAKKPLKEYAEKELPKLVSQLEQVQIHYLNK